MKIVPLKVKGDSLTREVACLSRLIHDNVVRYYTSWVERVNPELENRNRESKFYFFTVLNLLNVVF